MSRPAVCGDQVRYDAEAKRSETERDDEASSDDSAGDGSMASGSTGGTACESDPDALVARILFSVLCLIQAALWLSCCPLWTTTAAFPRVPWVAWLLGFPVWLEQLLLWMTFGGCVLAAVVVAVPAATRRILRANSSGSTLFSWQRWLAAGLLFGCGLLMLLDQHRVQPWMYQFACLMLCWTCCRSSRDALTCAGLLAIGLYIHSAVSKLDHSFLTSYGQQFVGVIVDLLGGDMNRLGELSRRVLAALLPLGELFVGAGLIVKRTRAAALLILIVMHAALIVILGPWGLQHRPGVLIWNVLFLIQGVLVFGWAMRRGRAVMDSLAGRIKRLWRESRLAGVTCLVLLGLPLLEPWGLWDPWPSWALYASKTERCSLFIHESALPRMTGPIRAHIAPPQSGTGWCYVNLDAWSLTAIGAPVYPHTRYRFALARAISEAYQLNDEVRIEWRSQADRFDGTRTSTSIRGRAAIERWCRRYRLNTQARNPPWSSSH